MQVNFVLGFSNIAAGVLIILVCVPLLKDKIGPNPFYGVRIKKAFESRENWFKLQRFGGRQLIIWSGVLMAFGVLALSVPNNQTFLLIASFAPSVLLLVPIIQILRYAKTL